MSSKSWEILTKNIRTILGSKNLSVSDLARISGIQRSQIQKIMDQTNAPGLIKIEQIAKALGTTPSDLLFDYSKNATFEAAVKALDALDPEKKIPRVQGARALLTEDMSLIHRRADEVRAATNPQKAKKS